LISADQRLGTEVWAYLTDVPLQLWPRDWNHFIYFRYSCGVFDDELRALWEAHRQAILREWIAKHPGTRPTCWWRYDAPEPRSAREPEAAFLQRHDLFLQGERAAIKERTRR
jgi:hypothetical protein